MEKRIQMIDGGISVAAIVVLTASEYNILESKNKGTQKKIDAIAKDLAVKWAIETGGNISTCAISRQYGVVVGREEMHEMELVADKFMNAIREIAVPVTKNEDECPSHETSEEDAEREEMKNAIESAIADEDEIRKKFSGLYIFGIIKDIPIGVSLYEMPIDLWFELLKTYYLYNNDSEK